MNPVYCIGCRQHIPQALSNAGRGLCPDCLAKINQAQPAPPQPSQVPPLPNYAQPQYQQPPQSLYAHGIPTAVPPSLQQPPRTPWYQSLFGFGAPAQPMPGQFGPCPHCHGPYVMEFANYTANGSSTGLRSGGCGLVVIGFLTICLGIGPFFIVLGFVLWIVGICLPTRTQTSTSRACNGCGFRWQV